MNNIKLFVSFWKKGFINMYNFGRVACVAHLETQRNLQACINWNKSMYWSFRLEIQKDKHISTMWLHDMQANNVDWATYTPTWVTHKGPLLPKVPEWALFIITANLSTTLLFSQLQMTICQFMNENKNKIIKSGWGVYTIHKYAQHYCGSQT